MSGSTIYDIRVRYTADDKASKTLGSIASSADRAKISLGQVKGLILAVGTGAAMMAGKRALIDYNSQIDQMKIGMSTIITMQMHKPWEQARKEADRLVENLQEIAKKSPATTKDFVEMASAIAPAVAMMGGGVGKLQSLTQGAVIAGMATGTRPDVAALDIQQMLMGTVNLRDRMARQLLGSRGIDHLDFNKKTAKERAEITESLLNDPALKKAADAMGESFAGQVSTFKDQLQIGLGKVGLPLMQEITKEVKKWNTWIEKNPAKIRMITKELSSMLISSFNFLKDTAKFFVDHRETLLAIAQAFLVFKGTQIAGMALNTVVGGLKNFTNTIRSTTVGMVNMIGGAGGATGVRGAFGGLINVLRGAGGVIPSLGLLAAGAFTLWKILNKPNADREAGAKRLNAALGERAGEMGRLADLKRQRDVLERALMNKGIGVWEQKNTPEYAELQKLSGSIAKMEERMTFNTKMTPAQMQEDARILRDLREISPGMAKIIAEDLSGYDKSALINNKKQLGLTGLHETDVIQVLDSIYSRYRFRLGELEKLAYPEKFAQEEVAAGEEWSPGNIDKLNMNVTINKIEVASEDPDRFVFGAVKAFERAAKNPTQAEHAITGGF